jgi:hypothetical protein
VNGGAALCEGRNSLKEALLTPTGEINWEKLLDLADSKGAEAQQQQASVCYCSSLAPGRVRTMRRLIGRFADLF